MYSIIIFMLYEIRCNGNKVLPKYLALQNLFTIVTRRGVRINLMTLFLEAAIYQFRSSLLCKINKIIENKLHSFVTKATRVCYTSFSAFYVLRSASNTTRPVFSSNFGTGIHPASAA